MKPITSHLRSKNIKVSAYLDDIFFCAQSEDILKSHVNIVINLLNDLGLDVCAYIKSYIFETSKFRNENHDDLFLSLTTKKPVI